MRVLISARDPYSGELTIPRFRYHYLKLICLNGNDNADGALRREITTLYLLTIYTTVWRKK